jgi:hypothetical protein
MGGLLCLRKVFEFFPSSRADPRVSIPVALHIFLGISFTEAGMQRPHVMSGGRYPVLRALAIFYVFGAALAVLATLIGIVYILARGPGSVLDRVIISTGAIVGGFIAVVSMLAVAEVLKLFIDMEHNTRMMGSGAAAPARTMVAVGPGMAEITSTSSGGDGHINRIDALDEETAEAALIRGH